MLTPPKYLNPFTDFGFKKLFGSEANKDLLIDFLNEVIREQGTITNIHYLKSEQLGAGIVNRRAIFDIYCENERGEKFIVEMQKVKQNYFKDRSIFYSTFPIQEQGIQGEWNFSLKAVYLIGVLDFVFDEDKDDLSYYHHEIKLRDTKKHQVFYDKLTFIYLEMPKFDKTEEELETHFDKWMYVLKNLPILEKRPLKLQEKVFESLFKTAEIAQFTSVERTYYEDSLKIYRDLKNSMDTAEEEGLKKGMVKGKIEIAKKMLSKNFPVDVIIECTGLSAEEINNLQLSKPCN
ncbi:hypothetical protein Barb6_00137 [Bacteroidales bacterium Barb6]|nr:hypothetical protein Barb6_00184 [Bacteroidales bacterium Barb6]OAV73532.1 hypothetical protein Barb6_00137 [Bacteroidales bacterium Barb6]